MGRLRRSIGALCTVLHMDLGEHPFYEVWCISLVGASKKKSMEREYASFIMNA